MSVAELDYPQVQRAMPEKDKAETVEYVSVKIDKEVYKVAKAAAALEGKDIQDYLSDVMNVVASKALGHKPVRRKSNA